MWVRSKSLVSHYFLTSDGNGWGRWRLWQWETGTGETGAGGDWGSGETEAGGDWIIGRLGHGETGTGGNWGRVILGQGETGTGGDWGSRETG